MTEQEFISEIPDEIIDMFYILGNKNRAKIFLMIANDIRKDVSFGDLKDNLELNPNVISTCLSSLQSALLIENNWMKLENRKGRSFYRVSNIGQILIGTIIELMERMIDEVNSFQESEYCVVGDIIAEKINEAEFKIKQSLKSIQYSENSTYPEDRSNSTYDTPSPYTEKIEDSKLSEIPEFLWENDEIKKYKHQEV